jgi:3-oxoadipate enol-lactonase
MASLHYRLEGEGARTVVLSGSLGSELSMWEAQADALAPRFGVLRYDHPGHGGSPPAQIRSMADVAGLVLALLDERGRVSFCGLSVGGMVGMELALGAPDRIERLVLACTSPKLGEPDFWLDRAATVRAGGVEAVADTVVGRWFTPRYAAAHPEVVRRYRATLASTPREPYARLCAAIAGFDVRARLREIAARTFVMTGADDPAIPAADGELLAREIPGARASVVPGAHLPNVEQPAAFNAALVTHLSSAA